MQLIYLSPVPWSSFSQRPHKFVEWFHAEHGKEVLWIEPYPTRFPLLSDLRRVGPPGGANNPHIPSWLKVICPKALPIEPFPGSGLLNALIWNSLLKEVIAFSQLGSTLLAFGKPSVLALTILERLNGTTSLYDAMDDFPAFYAAFSRMAMKRRQRQLVSSVTHVIASSTTIWQQLSRIRSDVQLVPNGLEAKILSTPKYVTVVNEKNILGYVGTIGPWFDWEWIISLAETRPLDVVRLIGPMFTSSPDLLPANIEILPSCMHQDALRAMQEFTVGLIPFKQNELTDSVDPIKYYEYRALGLPVISTNFGEMTSRGEKDGVFLSRNKKDINQLVQKALLYRSDREVTKQFIQLNTWEARFYSAKIY